MYQEPNHNEYEPWEGETYRTGSTQPPKNHNGLVAALLVVIIAMFGIITILGISNVRLFRQTQNQNPDESLSIDFSDPDETTTDIGGTSTDNTDDQVDLQSAPTSAENIPQEGGLSLQEIYEKTIDSVVSITCTLPGGSSTGTGIVLSDKGYIATNCHVIEKATAIEVLLTDGRRFSATTVGMDSISDLAVVHIQADALLPATLGDSASLRVGDSVVAIGDPLGTALRGTMTDGIVSAINRNIDVDGRTMHLIQTNAALNSGNSGGPLINCYGQVVGINTIKIRDSVRLEGVEGLGFAIPSNTVQEIVNQLISQGYVSGRPSLGLTGEAISNFYLFYYNLPEGLYISEVTPGGSAQAAGLQHGDILLSLDGVRITTPEALESLLYKYTPGDTASCVIYRSGRQYTAQLTVGEAKG